MPTSRPRQRPGLVPARCAARASSTAGALTTAATRTLAVASSAHGSATLVVPAERRQPPSRAQVAVLPGSSRAPASASASRGPNAATASTTAATVRFQPVRVEAGCAGGVRVWLPRHPIAAPESRPTDVVYVCRVVVLPSAPSFDILAWCAGIGDSGSDETGCHVSSCATDEFQCGIGGCITAGWICDGYDDCGQFVVLSSLGAVRPA